MQNSELFPCVRGAPRPRREPASAIRRGIARTFDVLMGVWTLTLLGLVLSCFFPTRLLSAAAGEPPLPSGDEPLTATIWLPMVVRYDLFTVQPARIRELEISLDATRAVSATITEGGGVLNAIDAMGTRFTLTLPPQALVVTTTVTMTPIKGVIGLASGVRFAAGVHLEPEGQRLFQLATLTISPAVTIPFTRELPFTSAAGGQNAHSYPVASQPRTPTFTIGHFSEYAVSEVDPLPVEPEFDSVPAGDEAQFETALHDLFSTERARQLSGQTPDPQFWEKLEFLMRSYFVNVILPLLGPMETDCAAMERNAGKALTWGRQAALMFGHDRLAAEQQAVLDAYKAGLINCWDKRYPCINRQAPADLQAMYALARLGQMMGLMEGNRFQPDLLPDCQCVRAAAATAWRGQISYFYQRSAGGSFVAESADVEAHLAGTGSPSGSATLSVRRWYGTRIGGGPIVPYEPATNQYSRMGLRIYPRTCTYWFHVSIHVVAEVCDSRDRCVTSIEPSGAVNSAYLPARTVSDNNLILAGSGYFEAHGSSFARTGYDDIFYPNDNHITDNGNLGRAFVMWRFWPLAENRYAVPLE